MIAMIIIGILQIILASISLSNCNSPSNPFQFICALKSSSNTLLFWLPSITILIGNVLALIFGCMLRKSIKGEEEEGILSLCKLKRYLIIHSILLRQSTALSQQNRMNDQISLFVLIHFSQQLLLILDVIVINFSLICSLYTDQSCTWGCYYWTQWKRREQETFA